ncbi:MAG: hypothetical protein ACE5GN_04705 [Waddliaceae bacterium]
MTAVHLNLSVLALNGRVGGLNSMRFPYTIIKVATQVTRLSLHGGVAVVLESSRIGA